MASVTRSSDLSDDGCLEVYIFYIYLYIIIYDIYIYMAYMYMYIWQYIYMYIWHIHIYIYIIHILYWVISYYTVIVYSVVIINCPMRGTYVISWGLQSAKMTSPGSGADVTTEPTGCIATPKWAQTCRTTAKNTWIKVTRTAIRLRTNMEYHGMGLGSWVLWS